MMLGAVYYRTNLTYRQIALLFGISKSAVDRVIGHLAPLLALSPVTLETPILKQSPPRNGGTAWPLLLPALSRPTWTKAAIRQSRRPAAATSDSIQSYPGTLRWEACA